MSRMRRIKDLEIQISEMVETLAVLKTWPKEPVEDYAVITFSKTFGSSSNFPYHYAAIKAGGRWWITGKVTRSFSWEELLDFIDSAAPTMLEAGSWVSLRRDHA